MVFSGFPVVNCIFSDVSDTSYNKMSTYKLTYRCAINNQTVDNLITSIWYMYTLSMKQNNVYNLLSVINNTMVSYIIK